MPLTHLNPLFQTPNNKIQHKMCGRFSPSHFHMSRLFVLPPAILLPHMVTSITGCSSEAGSTKETSSNPLCLCLCFSSSSSSFRALQPSSVGHDVCDVPDRRGGDSFCVWILQSRRLQSKFGERQRWVSCLFASLPLPENSSSWGQWAI